MTFLKKAFCFFMLLGTLHVFSQSTSGIASAHESYTFPYPFSLFCSSSLLLHGSSDASSGSALLLPSSMETLFKDFPIKDSKLDKSVRIIFYKSLDSISEIEGILQTMYPDVSAIIVCNFTPRSQVKVSTVSSRNSVFFRIIAKLSAREPATRFSLISHYLYSTSEGRSIRILDSMNIEFPDSFSTTDFMQFWSEFINLLSSETYKTDKIYLLPLATLLVPVWETVFYALFMFFTLFNIAIFLASTRAKIRYGTLYWITTLALCITVWFSLVFSLYLVLALFVIQPHFGRRVKIPLFLLLTLFWFGVLLHDFVLLISGALPVLQSIYCIFFLLHYLALAFVSFSRRKTRL